MMKKMFAVFCAVLFTEAAFAQITNPAPYCSAAFSNNYNMIDSMDLNGTKFSFGTMGSVSNSNTYKYYNTTVLPNLSQGSSPTLKLRFFAPNDMEPGYFAVWIDFNKNNTFESSELVMQNSNTTMTLLPVFGAAVTPITKTIPVPATAVVGKTRMRIMRGQDLTNPTTYTSTFVLNPCPAAGSNSYGCTYDFDINIVAGGGSTTTAPKAAFSSTPTIGTSSTVFNLKDASTNTPTSYTWTFTPNTVTYQGGTSSTSANPQVKFTAAGSYTVKLKVSNAAGSDSLTKSNYIKINPTSVSYIQKNNIHFYPNPTNSIIVVDDSYKGMTFELIGIDGRIYRSFVLTDNKISVSDLPNGLYNIRMTGLDAIYMDKVMICK